MKKESLFVIVAVIGGIILVALGFYSGLNWAQNQIQKAQLESPIADLLTSKVVTSMDVVVLGEVAEISGRNLILTQDGDSLTISVGEDSSIRRLVSSEETSETPTAVVAEKMGFEEIKIGDTVDISCQLKTDGTLEATTVTVLP